MLKAHPGVFIIPSWLRDACVRSEYPGSLILGSIRVLSDPGLDREAFRRFVWAYAGVTGARRAKDVMYREHPGSLVPDRTTACPVLNDFVGLLVNLGREAFRRFFYAHAWGEVAMNAVYSHAVN